MHISLTLFGCQKKWKISVLLLFKSKLWHESKKTLVEWSWQVLAQVRLANSCQISKPVHIYIYIYTYLPIYIPTYIHIYLYVYIHTNKISKSKQRRFQSKLRGYWKFKIVVFFRCFIYDNCNTKISLWCIYKSLYVFYHRIVFMGNSTKSRLLMLSRL